jgi:hypothetical protein
MKTITKPSKQKSADQFAEPSLTSCRSWALMYAKHSGEPSGKFAGVHWHTEAGELHSLDGPAISFPNGRKEFWVRGKNITRAVRVWAFDQGLGNDPAEWSDEARVMFRLQFS